MTVDPRLQRTCDRALDEPMAEFKGIKAVAVSTKNDFEVAARVGNTA